MVAMTMKRLLSTTTVALLLGCLATPAIAQSNGREIQIRVDERGYHPGSVHVERGETVTLVFTRTTARGCGGTLVIPSRNVRRELPVDQPVSVRLSIRERERLSFTCGMGMYRGSLVVD